MKVQKRKSKQEIEERIEVSTDRANSGILDVSLTYFLAWVSGSP